MQRSGGPQSYYTLVLQVWMTLRTGGTGFWYYSGASDAESLEQTSFGRSFLRVTDCLVDVQGDPRVQRVGSKERNV